jgi:hypothetical protein
MTKKLEGNQVFESKSEPTEDNGIHFSCTYKSCTAEVVVATQVWGNELKKVFSVPIIESKDKGKGHATFLTKRLEGLARQRRCNEIWYPTILNPILELMLLKRGYVHASFGVHPAMGEEVFGLKKVLSTLRGNG